MDDSTSVWSDWMKKGVLEQEEILFNLLGNQKIRARIAIELADVLYQFLSRVPEDTALFDLEVQHFGGDWKVVEEHGAQPD